MTNKVASGAMPPKKPSKKTGSGTMPPKKPKGK
jgi:hypothetical protein